MRHSVTVLGFARDQQQPVFPALTVEAANNRQAISKAVGLLRRELAGPDHVLDYNRIEVKVSKQ